MRAETKAKYLQVVALYLAGEHPTAITDTLNLSLRTIRRALSWYSTQKADLTSAEKIELAICKKKWLKRRALSRLAQLEAGWTVTKTKTQDGKVIEETTENRFSPNAEVGLYRVVQSLDYEIDELLGISNEIIGDEDDIEVVDISIVGVDTSNYYRLKND